VFSRRPGVHLDKAFCDPHRIAQPLRLPWHRQGSVWTCAHSNRRRRARRLALRRSNSCDNRSCRRFLSPGGSFGPWPDCAAPITTANATKLTIVFMLAFFVCNENVSIWVMACRTASASVHANPKLAPDPVKSRSIHGKRCTPGCTRSATLPSRNAEPHPLDAPRRCQTIGQKQ
jgi:hypothetical protein